LLTQDAHCVVFRFGQQWKFVYLAHKSPIELISYYTKSHH
jgi:hypothetical protein